MQDINNVSNIEELLCFFDYFIKNGHSITIIWVKFTLNISSDLSQKIMNYYFQKRKEELCVTYLVEGYKNNCDEYTYAVISERDIENVKKKGSYTINIYSLQAKSNETNFSMLWMQELNEINKRIVSKNGIYEKLNDFVYEYEKSDSPWDYLTCSPTKRDNNATPKKKLITNPDLKSSIIVSANRSVSKESKEFLSLVSPKKLIGDCNMVSNSVSRKGSKSSSVNKKPKQTTNNNANIGTNSNSNIGSNSNAIIGSNSNSITDTNNNSNTASTNDQIKYSKIVKREKYDTNIFNEVSTGPSSNEQDNIAKNSAQNQSTNLLSSEKEMNNIKETLKKLEINKTRDEYGLFDQDIPDKNTASNETEIEVSQNLSENEHKQDCFQPSKYNTELTKIKLEESTERNKTTEPLDPDNIESDGMKKVKLDKETELFFENGYLVTVDKEPPIKKNLIKSFANGSSNDDKNKSTDNKKKRNLQQILLTNFFKKKK
ncbi:conserved Plasmodium protein, unknown function [Plasmodium berghei]|uniref:DNA polymerase delta subunit 3 n=2 Tax=Plasmodium berghei TaxID=5821 RepID=A0A509AMU7_PLABA|nr:conserved Plasmodium protein, unknown function [Plasmodium berghei ANKA]CXI83603.1 conserved Plasmodium protein, unknown function [Plasmodium berghei]SCM25717.1 conserved Plasmodium protein, unknown function [Plasmodium berghei]SCN27466.1 conserved Plasmodium protein, unknown function [Plasmodium berghei]SCO62176.1 conserved Plasmodium protein, unknown function [Plasmodium berghei]SCO63893.1 conserved Plasmodium protein, unknown function [Plasmodium berghei]|eukprot:XP_034423098.1 conserved Plasmodium protein, unknown function [Plasmodium berghei ANKA]